MPNPAPVVCAMYGVVACDVAFTVAAGFVVAFTHVAALAQPAGVAVRFVVADASCGLYFSCVGCLILLAPLNRNLGCWNLSNEQKGFAVVNK